MKDKATILNDLVASSMDIVEHKTKEMEVVLTLMIEGGKDYEAEQISMDINNLTNAVLTIRKHIGCF